MKTIPKALIGTVAAGAMAMTAAVPAQAQFRDRDDDGIDVGDVIAGALIIGGIAAVASAAGRNRDRGYVYEGQRYDNRYDDRYDNRYDDRYNQAGDSRQAVEQCVNVAERNASRASRRGNAQVTDIRDIKRKRDGYVVKGRIAVNTGNSNWRSGWGNDYRGWNQNYQGYDAGKFTCDVRYGRVVDLDYSGVRGLS